MNRFTERIEQIRAAAQAVAPEDSFVIVGENLSHIGNGTFAVSIKRERDEPSEWTEPGDDIYNDTLASVIVRFDADVDTIGPALANALTKD